MKTKWRKIHEKWWHCQISVVKKEGNRKDKRMKEKV